MKVETIFLLWSPSELSFNGLTPVLLNADSL
jgi:hypothetical protein